LTNKKKKIKELEEQTQSQNFWKNSQKASRVAEELADLKEEIKKWQNLKQKLAELKELSSLAEGDEKLEKEIEQKQQELEKEIKKQELETFLSGRYDKGNAVLSIYSGAGGTDAQDWAAMLLRMYQRYCHAKGFKTKILHQSWGEPGGPEGRIGLKSATIEIKGKNAYGYLKNESGVHRLVRISPFSAQGLRHTSFVLVEVLPELRELDEQEIKINPDDLKIDTFRASGPGGQYVNKRQSAVRITHLPTKITVACQSERLLGLNRQKAMKLLYSKLYQLKKKQKKAEIEKVKGDNVSIEWGNQIRSYILHPYKLVKDHRTDIQTSNVQAVLDGALDEFIEAEIKLANFH